VKSFVENLARIRESKLPYIFVWSLLILASPIVAAETFPSKTVHLVVPAPPGSSPDLIARVIGNRLSAKWAQAIIVENRAGAANSIGSDVVAKAPPDGHTLLMATNNVLTINPLLSSKMTFDPNSELVSVTMLGVTPFLLVTGPSVNVDSVSGLIAEAKRRNKGLTFATSGVGSNQQMFAEMLRSVTGAPMTPVPYKGGPQSIVDVIAGVVDMQFGAVPSTLEHVRAGKLRALAVTGQKRINVLPDVPTFTEAGVTGFTAEGWIGLSATAGTPLDTLARINRDVVEILKDPEVIATLAGYGIEAQPGTAADMAGRISREREAWARIISASRIHVE
jgi:tripartite-type tricarboxylate transporter receptor subunit TctC